MTLQRVLDEAEARQLPALIAEWSERSDALRWVARALQLDLPLLIERPALVLTCLHRRCAWLGDTVFYRGRGAVPAEADSLAELIAEWSAQRPRRWLRAVRPPPFALDAGIVEEYRTNLKGELRFSADGTLIGVVGETAVGWERATGRSVDVHDRLEPRVVTWKLAREHGRIALSSPARSVEISIAEGERVSTIFELGDDLVLVETSYEADPYDYGYEYVLYLVDTATSRILWRVDGEIRVAHRIGDTLHTFGREYVQRSLRDGAELACQPFPYLSDTVFAANSRLFATRDTCVIRVWDLDQLDPHVTRCRAGAGTISPDGTRVLSDCSLYDARTGAFVADIPFSGRGGGWLEGGPPTGAWELVDRVVVEVLFRNSVWDSTDGRLLAQYERFFVNAGDVVRHDPRGRYLAIFRRRNELTAHDVLTGATLFERTVEIAGDFRDRAFGFSESGDDLWWQTADGCYAASTATWEPRRVEAPLEAPARMLDIVDGVLIVGDLAAPMDSTHATYSRDERIFVGTDHYIVEDG